MVFLTLLFAVNTHGFERLYIAGEYSGTERILWEQMGLPPQTVSCSFVTRQCLEPLSSTLGEDDRRWLLVKEEGAALISVLLDQDIGVDQISGIALWGVPDSGWKLPDTIENPPPIWVLTSIEESAEKLRVGRMFVEGYRQLGGDAEFYAVAEDAFSQPAQNEAAIMVASSLMEREIEFEELAIVTELRSHWDRPPIDHNDFHQFPQLIQQEPSNLYARTGLEEHFRTERHLLDQWDTNEITTFDLLGYRDLIAPDARYLTLRNQRGEEMYLDLDRYAQYQPVLVIGVGDVDNLYRFSTFYQTLKQYS